jgi:hypothetical protein
MLLTNHPCFDEQSLYWLSISSGVRINQNGFFFFDSPINMPPDTSHPCPRTLNALCYHNNYTFMPCTQTPVTSAVDAPPPFDYFWRSEVKCAKQVSMHAFDVLPCDLRRGTSLVWADGMISVQYDLELDYWSNISVLLIMLWLIINLGETIALVLEVKGSAAHNHNTVVLSIVLVSIIVSKTPDTFWATYNDVVLHWYTVAYIAAYSVYHMQNKNTINVIVGCMMLVASRYYQTNETPYVATFLFLIFTRVIQKLYFTLWGKSDFQTQGWKYVRFVFICADIGLCSLLYIYSFIPSFCNPIQAHLYLLGILFASHCLGSFIAYYVKAKQTMSNETPVTST